MATERLGAKAPGSIVKLRESGDLQDFYVARHDAYTAGRTLLVRRYNYNNQQWHTSNVNAYATSTIDAWLNGTYLGLLSSDIREHTAAVDIPYTPGNGNYTVSSLSRRVFLLSFTELDRTDANYARVEGTALAIASTLQIARNSSNTAQAQWTRTPYVNNTSYGWSLNTSGAASPITCSSSSGIRPALTLPSILFVDDETAEVLGNQPPTTPPSITLPARVASGQNALVQWEASTDPDGDDFEYILERSDNVGAYAEVYSGPELFYVDPITADMTFVTWRVKAVDTFGNESDWRTSVNVRVKHRVIAPSGAMLLTVYDPHTLTPIGLLEEITALLWTRRYWAVGEFKLLLPFTERHAELIRPRRLLGKRGDRELAEIRYVYFRRNDFGMEEIEAQGRFLTGWLDKRVVAVPLVTQADTQTILHQLVDMNAVNPANPDRAIPGLLHAYGEPYTDSGMIQYTATPYLSLREACQNAAVAAKLGFRIETDIRAKTHYFHVYKGEDHTAGQTENQVCVFSPDFDNILEQQFTHSIENFRTAGYVGGQEREGVPRVYVEVGGGVGLDRDEEFFDAGDIEDKGGNYAAKLISRGDSELAHKEESVNFTSKIDLNVTPRYKEDFDVGDRVTCINRRWGVSINSRVTEVVETYQQGRTELDVTFGVSLPTLGEKLKG